MCVLVISGRKRRVVFKWGERERRFAWIVTERGARPPGRARVGQAVYFQ